MVLPEILGKDMKYIVEHPEVKALVERVRQAEQRTGKRIDEMERSSAERVEALESATRASIEAVARATEELGRATEENIKRLIAVAQMPRKPVYHSDGEIAGAIPVEKLELH